MSDSVTPSVPRNPDRWKTTALILIGFQNDYFAGNGILHDFLEDRSQVAGVLTHTVTLIDALAPSAVQIISTPILFTDDYREIQQPVGILGAIRSCGAFRRDTPGGRIERARAAAGHRIRRASRQGEQDELAAQPPA